MGNQTWQIVKGLEGEIFEESFATRVVDVSPTNPEAYVQAVRNMEKAYHENGYEEFSLIFINRSLVELRDSINIVLAPSLQMLGDIFGALATWAQEAYSLVILEQNYCRIKYRCEPVYLPSNAKINVFYLN